MPFRETGSVRYFFFDSLVHPALRHAILTRKGGVSPPPWHSLNVGGTVGDERHRVAENRRRSFEALGLELSTMHDAWQVHSSTVVAVRSPRGESPLQQADILITDVPGVSLFMRFADCVPILLFDPVHRAIGLVHAGWLGTVGKAARAAVQAMQERYGTSAERLLAAIGPSVGPDHYPVRDDVIREVRRAFGKSSAKHLSTLDGTVRLDLWAANQNVLQEAGVRSIETAQLCTACDPECWYSHRGEGGKTGRFGALIALG
jgi:hypothetical protein